MKVGFAYLANFPLKLYLIMFIFYTLLPELRGNKPHGDWW